MYRYNVGKKSNFILWVTGDGEGYVLVFGNYYLEIPVIHKHIKIT